MNFLILVRDVIVSFFEHLPQYAALITSSVAISLFLIKEHKEKKKKEIDKAKENEKNESEKIAIRSVLAREAFFLLKQVKFFIELHEDIKNAVKVKIEIMPGNMWRQIQIECGDIECNPSLLIPTSPVKFNHSFTVSAIKIDPDFYQYINQLNIAIDVMSKSLDVCIGSAVENDVDKVKIIADFMVNGNIEKNIHMTKYMINAISVFKNEMSGFKDFPEVSAKIKSTIGIDF